MAVIHIDDELHGRFKYHCVSSGIEMRAVVERLVRDELDRYDRVEKVIRVEVPREIPPWELPPFWERDGRKNR